MKVRTTIAGTAFRAKLTALCWGALTILAPVALSACSGSTSTPTVSSFSPTVATLPASDGTTSSNTPGVTTPATVTPVATVTQTVTVPAATATSFVPTAAPVTGGGGTAGFQDSLLLAVGAAAILAGAGGLIYRRWLGRGH